MLITRKILDITKPIVKVRVLVKMEAGKLMSTASDSIQVNDQKIHFVKRGSGSHPLLFLPGALGTATSDFSPQIENFDPDMFTIIGWDPPGYGQSRPPNRNFENFFNKDADMAVATMKNLGFEKFSMLGWSDGGITALIASARYPENINKLVIWGANSYIAKSDIEMIEQVADISKWSDRMRKPMEDTYGDSFPDMWLSWVNAYKSYYANGGDICSDLLKNISAPSLVIHGAKDAMVAGEHIDFLHENIKGSNKFVFKDGKHNLHFKYQKEFNKMVQDFLKE